jgi:hypothetical protein
MKARGHAGAPFSIQAGALPNSPATDAWENSPGGRIMENGTAGWYWEIVTKTHGVLARGLADTYTAACAETAQAARKAKRDQMSGSLEGFHHSPAAGFGRRVVQPRRT